MNTMGAETWMMSGRSGARKEDGGPEMECLMVFEGW